MLWCHIRHGVQKKGVNLVDHPACHIGGSRSNQKEPLASPDSPSSCASLVTLHSPVGCPCVGDSVNPGGGVKLGGKWDIVLASHTLIAFLIILIPPPSC